MGQEIHRSRCSGRREGGEWKHLQEGEKGKEKHPLKKKTGEPVSSPAGPVGRPGLLQRSPVRGPVKTGPKAG